MLFVLACVAVDEWGKGTGGIGKFERLGGECGCWITLFGWWSGEDYSA